MRGSRDRLARLVRAYRESGFLPGLTEPDDELARRIEPTDPGSAHDHLDVLGLDRGRVWWEDIEVDMLPEDRPYATALERWAAISGDALLPDEIEETWADEEEGPVTVSFVQAAKRVELHPKWNRLARLGRPARLNRLIAPSGRRFVQGHTYGQDAFVLCVTAVERERLREIGFPLAPWWPDED